MRLKPFYVGGSRRVHDAGTVAYMVRRIKRNIKRPTTGPSWFQIRQKTC
ncbi:hypothetical protein D3OALGB2SA_1868 [Olavius algarvensis associated proteobacterium Delta 3]|nr:hypothetical protein D3OALGB2SA_1868 [Olavius algarvensis associated proteobacterium Delta 3]